MDDNKVIRVRDVMKTKFDLVDGLATVSEALAEMRHVENKSLIVDKRHEDDEFGMLLISDIARQVLAKDRSPDRVNVYEV
ncbi:MAG TPA: histidine kinase, partial [Gammaproteobacteria bacterium]|nr:histidine kinase [Gammaproteobacteria bacterium]